MAVKCPYCFQFNSTGTIRCIFCSRYLDDKGTEAGEDELMGDHVFDYRKGVKIDLAEQSGNELTEKEFVNIAKVTGIVVLIVSFLILILKTIL